MLEIATPDQLAGLDAMPVTATTRVSGGTRKSSGCGGLAAGAAPAPNLASWLLLSLEEDGGADPSGMVVSTRFS